MVTVHVGNIPVYFVPSLFYFLVHWAFLWPWLLRWCSPCKLFGVGKLSPRRPGDRDWVGTRGALRARSLSHTIPLPPPSQGWEAERASNFAPIRSRPFPGSPCWATGPLRTELEELCCAPRQSLGRRSAPLLASQPLPLPLPPDPRPTGSTGDRTRPGRALCVCKPELRSPGLPDLGQGCSCSWRCPHRSRALSCLRREAGRRVPKPLYKRGQGDTRKG